jgi:4-hydroxyphenylpyruvate dioxygenase
MSQGKANFVLTTPMTPDDSAADHIRKHGDGVRDIALEVDDADQAFEEAVRRGAQPAEEPHDLKDEHGVVRRAAVHTYGDTIHSLISYKDYKGPFLPGFMAAPVPGDDCGICASTISSGMSNSAKCSTGRITTRACSASTVTSLSTIRIFRPSTAR